MPLSSRFPLRALLAAYALSGYAIADSAVTTVWFDKPGVSFHEATVLGNGRLGAMDIGGVARERIVLNENTVWSGGPYEADKADAHKCLPEVRAKLFAGDFDGAEKILKSQFRYADGVQGWFDKDQFGCYQTLGDLTLDFGSPKVTSPSGHAKGDGKGIGNTVDGESSSKWCVTQLPAKGTLVVWQTELGSAEKLTTYSLTSGEDVPERDPRHWVLEGSADGKAWSEMDRRDLPAPFAKRNERLTFSISKPGAFRFYRLTFTPEGKQFQIAEISLSLPNSAPASDYTRKLDLMTGVARTEFTRDGVRFTRELVASKPDEVIALRLKADKPGALNFTAGLSRKEIVAPEGVASPFRAEGAWQVMEGQMRFNPPGKPTTGGVKYLALLSARIPAVQTW